MLGFFGLHTCLLLANSFALGEQVIRQAISTPRLPPRLTMNPNQMAQRNQMPLQQQMFDDHNNADAISGFRPINFQPPSDLSNLVPISPPFNQNSIDFDPATFTRIAQLQQQQLQLQQLQQLQRQQLQPPLLPLQRQFNYPGMGGGSPYMQSGMGGVGAYGQMGGNPYGISGQGNNGGMADMSNGIYGNQAPSYGTQTCTCTAEYAPLCGSDKHTYSNKCQFDCAQRLDYGLQVAYQGECSATATTETVSWATYESADYVPTDPCSWKCYGGSKQVCTTNGTTYGNECKFWRAVCRESARGDTPLVVTTCVPGLSTIVNLRFAASSTPKPTTLATASTTTPVTLTTTTSARENVLSDITLRLSDSVDPFEAAVDNGEILLRT